MIDDDIFRDVGGTGTLLAARFHVGGAAHDGTDRIIYKAGTGALFYDRDGTGDDFAQIRFATLAKNLSLDNGDFVVVG